MCVISILYAFATFQASRVNSSEATIALNFFLFNEFIDSCFNEYNMQESIH